eukprot:3460564-Alexandrium_andersonii.AAC.1
MQTTLAHGHAAGISPGDNFSICEPAPILPVHPELACMQGQLAKRRRCHCPRVHLVGEKGGPRATGYPEIRR